MTGMAGRGQPDCRVPVAAGFVHSASVPPPPANGWTVSAAGFANPASTLKSPVRGTARIGPTPPENALTRPQSAIRKPAALPWRCRSQVPDRCESRRKGGVAHSDQSTPAAQNRLPERPCRCTHSAAWAAPSTSGIVQRAPRPACVEPRLRNPACRVHRVPTSHSRCPPTPHKSRCPTSTCLC